MIGSVFGGLLNLMGIPLQADMNSDAAWENFKYSKQLNEQQFGYQQQLQKQQNDFNLDIWNKQNEYNTAQSQVDRFRAAGLNPGIMMSGQGAGTAQSLTSANPSVPTSAQANFMQAPDAISAFGGLNQAIQAGMNLDVQKRIQDKQLALKDKELEIQDRNKNRELDISDKLAASHIRLENFLGENYQADTDVKKETVEEVKQRVVESKQRVDNLIKAQEEMDAKIEETRALAFKARQEGKYVVYNALTHRISANAQMITAQATKELYQHQGKLLDSQTKMNEQQCKNLVQQLQNMKKDGALKDIELEYQGQLYKADIRIKNGQADAVDIQNWKDSKTKYADVVNAYIGVINNGAQTVSNVTSAAVDVYTFGVTTKLPGSKNNLMEKQANFYGNGGFQTTSHMNPNQLWTIGHNASNSFTIGK